MHGILHFERFQKPIDYQKVIDRLSGETLETTLRIMETETDFDVLREIIEFLGYTDRAECVGALFKLIDGLDDGLYEKLKGRIFNSLLQTVFPLQTAQSKLVEENIDRLLRSSDPAILRRGEEMSRERFSSTHSH